MPCLHCFAQTMPGSLGAYGGDGVLEERCTEGVAFGGVSNRRFLIKPAVVDGDMTWLYAEGAVRGQQDLCGT